MKKIGVFLLLLIAIGTNVSSGYITLNVDDNELTFANDLMNIPSWMVDRIDERGTLLTYDPDKTLERYTILGLDWDRRKNRTAAIFDMDGELVGAFDNVYREITMINATTVALSDWDSNMIFWNLFTNATEYFPIPEEVDTPHHDFEYNPLTETFMILGREKVENVTVNGELKEHLTDTIFEFDKEGTVLWEWHQVDKMPIDFDQYYKQNITYRGSAEFIHANGLFWDYEEDFFYFDARHAHSFFKIDKATGDVIWHLGAWDSDFTLFDIDGNQVESLFHGQHDVKPIGNNHFILYNNDWMNILDPESSTSSFMEIEVDEDEMTAKVVWEYKLPSDTHYSAHTGGLDILPDGNRIGISGGSNNEVRHVREVNVKGEVVWEMSFNNTGMDRSEQFYTQPIVDLAASTFEASDDNVFSVSFDVWNTYENRLLVDGTAKIIDDTGTELFTEDFEFLPYWEKTPVTFEVNLDELEAGLQALYLVVENTEGLSTVTELTFEINAGFLNAYFYLGIFGMGLMVFLAKKRRI